jgi:hypothetical protein
MRKLSIVAILVTAAAIALCEPPKAAVAQSDAQRTFDKLKTLAGSWEGVLSGTGTPFDGKTMHFTLRVTSTTFSNHLTNTHFVLESEALYVSPPHSYLSFDFLDRRFSYPCSGTHENKPYTQCDLLRQSTLPLRQMEQLLLFTQVETIHLRPCTTVIAKLERRRSS